jgi:acetate kinase
MKILVLNAGSSSLRFQLIESSGWKRKFQGHVDGIGVSTCRLRGDIERKIKVDTHQQALRVALDALKEAGILQHVKEIDMIGHRVVHGGEKYHQPTLVTKRVYKDLKKLSSLAPLHNPPNLEGIKACMKLMKKAPNIAVFDTAFHSTIPEHTYLYGLPYSLYRKHGIRRYGFHGTSHSFVSEQATKWLKAKKKSAKRIITVHIGNGVSVTAVKNGKSVDTSMGFTPLEGVVMGTRAGDFDPAIAMHLMKTTKMSADDVNHIANNESGLKGLSGVSSDMRPLWAILQKPRHRHYKKVKRAYDVYAYRLARMIASMSVPLGGVDALVFTAGIGENGWYLRRDVCAQLEHLGIKLDAKKNKFTIEGNEGPIHGRGSKATVFVVRTNEELKIAKEVAKTYKK